MSSLTHFLYAAPSFFRGMASILDMGSTLTEYNTSKTPESADAKALRSDWATVGIDLMCAMEVYRVDVQAVQEDE